MAAHPLILALGQPYAGNPRRLKSKRVRDDAVIATGRSDYPNQVNNVLCFPYHFPGRAGRGRDHHYADGNRRRVRDCGAGGKEQDEVVAAAYGA